MISYGGGEAIGRKIYVAFNTAAPFVEAVATSRLHDSSLGGREKKEGGRGRGLHLSRCHIALTRDLDRSRGWSTISWLNRLINGSRGGSRPICITLGPPSPSPPWNRSNDTVLTHWDCFYEGLFICRTVKDARCQPGNDLCLLLLGLIIILGTICFISPSFPRDVIIALVLF